MSKIKIKLKPANGIKVKTDTTYLFDPTLEQAMIDLSKDWAIKTDGLVEEDGVGVDYSSKAYAIGGDGTETNNAKYYAEQAGISETNAASSASSASASEISASASAGVATSKASEASTSATNAANSESSAASSATSASNNAISAGNSATSAAGSASTASTQAGIATTQAGIASGYATSAGNSATSASDYATKSQTWAEGTDVQVAVLGGEKSAKGWAERAKELVDSIGTVLHYKGSVATIGDLPTSGQEVGDMWNVLADGSNWVWGGTDWDEISGIVDLSEYRKSADQDTIDSGKVDKVTAVSKVYGTDSTGNQTTYDKDSFGQVDDVKVNNVSVVTNKVANIDLTGKQDVLTEGTGIDITSNTISVDFTDVATSAQGGKADTAIQGVQINSTDLTPDANKKVNIPIASNGGSWGVVKVNSNKGITESSGQIEVIKASTAEISAKTNQYRPIVPYNLDEAVKVSVTTNANTLTSTEQANACSWLGASQQTIFRDWS